MSLKIKKRVGEEVPFNPQKIYNRIKRAAKGLNVNSDEIFIKVITSVPTEGLVTTKELDKLLKASVVYQLPDLSVVGEAGVVKLVVRDKKNDTSNDFSVVVGETDEVFTFNFKDKPNELEKNLEK